MSGVACSAVFSTWPFACRWLFPKTLSLCHTGKVPPNPPPLPRTSKQLRDERRYLRGSPCSESKLLLSICLPFTISHQSIVRAQSKWWMNDAKGKTRCGELERARRFSCHVFMIKDLCWMGLIWGVGGRRWLIVHWRITKGGKMWSFIFVCFRFQYLMMGIKREKIQQDIELIY